MIKIKGVDEFKFKAVVGDVIDGKPCLTVNYERICEDGNMQIILEGWSFEESATFSQKITYARFKRKYPRNRVYIKGYVSNDKKVD